MSGTWTVKIGHNVNNLTQRKYKNFLINSKVRMDSPPEYTAVVYYSPDITFNDVVEFFRDDGSGPKLEWVGFVEDLEISWDETSRYLNIGGRDLSLLLWRKYVENFNNPIKDTGGFFGTVSASELMKFLLRTPRSDLPVSSDEDTDPLIPFVYQYPYNKEGWGIDNSRFTGLYAANTQYGDINTTILRERTLYWSNSGNPYNITNNPIDIEGISGMNWNFNEDEAFISAYPSIKPTPFIDILDITLDSGGYTPPASDGSDIGKWVYYEEPIPTGTPIKHYVGKLLAYNNTTHDWFINSTIPIPVPITNHYTVYIDNSGVGTGTVKANIQNANYIKSIIGINNTAEFDFAPFYPSGSVTGINSCSLVIVWQPDGSWNPFCSSNCGISIWVNSIQSWCNVGYFGGKGGIIGYTFPEDFAWQTTQFDISNILKSVADVNNAKILLTEYGSLTTYITNVYLALGYGTQGGTTTEDRVDITFQPETIMGIYVECREHANNYPRNYKICTKGPIEVFDDTWTKLDPHNHIIVPLDEQSIDFDAWNNETAYFVKDYGAGGINGSPETNFDETFAFQISSSDPLPIAFVPFCISNKVASYDDLLDTPSDPTRYMSSVEVESVDANPNSLYVRFRLKQGDGGGGGYGWLPPTNGISIESNIPYFVHVTITTLPSGDVDLRYRLYSDYLMNGTTVGVGDFLYDTDNETFSGLNQTWAYLSSGLTFEYRYQAISYNNFQYGELWRNTMDNFIVPQFGEQFVNGDFSDNFTDWTTVNADARTTPSPPISGKVAHMQQQYGYPSYVSQTFAYPLATSVIETLSFYAQAQYPSDYFTSNNPDNNPEFDVELYYESSGNTPDVFAFYRTSPNGWTF